MQIPTFRQAIGGAAIREWLEPALKQFSEKGFAELPLCPRYLGTHLPRIGAGLAHIVASPARGRFVLDNEQFPRTDATDEHIGSGLMSQKLSERHKLYAHFPQFQDETRGDAVYKWIFHAFRGMESMLRERQAPLDELAEFFKSMHALDEAAFAIWCELGSLLDGVPSRTASGDSISMRFANGKQVTRALLYPLHAQLPGAPEALPHIDSCGGSTYWGSNFPGLFLWDSRGARLCPDEADCASVRLFLGRKFSAMAGRRFGPGTVHGVRDTGREQRAEGDRCAVVSFTYPDLAPSEAKWYRERLADTREGFYDPDPEKYVWH